MHGFNRFTSNTVLFSGSQEKLIRMRTHLGFFLVWSPAMELIELCGEGKFKQHTSGSFSGSLRVYFTIPMTDVIFWTCSLQWLSLCCSWMWLQRSEGGDISFRWQDICFIIRFGVDLRQNSKPTIPRCMGYSMRETFRVSVWMGKDLSSLVLQFDRHAQVCNLFWEV